MDCMLTELEFPLSAPRKLVSCNLCTPSLNRKTWNEVLGSSFVNISTTCKDGGRKQVIKTPLATFSRTKWWSNSICLERAGNMRFTVMWRALRLSHSNWGGSRSWMPISWRRKVSQVISMALDARDRYSTSVLDLETVGCRFEDHEWLPEKYNT